MKFQRIIEEVYCRPWLIKPSAHASIRRLIESRISKDYQAGMFHMEQEEDDGILTMRGNVAVISIEGTILRKASAFERMCGAIGTEEVEAAVMSASTDYRCAGIFIDVDSPGGTVGGTPELGAAIKAAGKSKPMMAFTGGRMCSAAYWLAAGAGEIVASPSADVGSIGVYLPWEDWSKAYEEAGVTVDLIRNEGADLKGAGYQGTVLTKAQRDDCQKRVDQIAAMFHAHVEANRGPMDPDTFRGQSFLAAEALERGLIDSIETKEAAFSQFAKSL